MSSRPPDRFAHRRGEPRTFAALWIVYLLLITMTTIGAVGLLGWMSPEVYRASARLMISATGVAIGIVWPLVRLSQEWPTRVARACLADVFIVIVSTQAVIWPQTAPWLAAWPTEVGAVLAASLAAWAFLIGGVLWGAMRSNARASRALWMVLILAMVLGMSGVAAALGEQSWLMYSPITGIFDAGSERPLSGQTAWVGPEHWQSVVWVLALGVIVWIVGGWVGGERDAARLD
ncbi:MAG: hypothetical protein IPK69_05750 [Phycisphaerales bacterium]|nr:MAG: hypothetical protein IPK69_05750 [Phycisphaerales bacterium]